MPTSSQPNASSSETRLFLISGAVSVGYVLRPKNCVTADVFFRGYGWISVGGRVKSDGFRGTGVAKFSAVGRKCNRSLGGLLSGLGGPHGVSFSDLLDADLRNAFFVYDAWASKKMKLSSTIRKAAALKPPSGETHQHY